MRLTRSGAVSPACAAVALAFGLQSATAQRQVSLPAGTPLPLTLPRHLAVRVGTPVDAELLYPVFVDNVLVLPAKTHVTGEITALAADTKRRNQGKLGADFTPYHAASVRFDTLLLGTGEHIPISAGIATDGAPIYRVVAPPPAHGNFVVRQIARLKTQAGERIAVFTGPDKIDRLKQFAYGQLPYHPERMESGTTWTIETTAPVALSVPPRQEPGEHIVRASTMPVVPHSPPEQPPTWMLEAYLNTPLSSETSRAGETIEATVAEPIFNPDGTVAVPQGSLLTGVVTRARPRRWFARAGELRFSFRQLTPPGAPAQSVRVAVVGADLRSDAQLAMDSEGNVKSKPQDKIVIPLLLAALAASPLHREHGDEDLVRKDTLASNGLGLIVFVVGATAGSPEFAAGVGAYSAVRSIYSRIVSRGKEVAFARDTRVVLQTTGTLAAALAPVASR